MVESEIRRNPGDMPLLENNIESGSAAGERSTSFDRRISVSLMMDWTDGR